MKCSGSDLAEAVERLSKVPRRQRLDESKYFYLRYSNGSLTASIDGGTIHGKVKIPVSARSLEARTSEQPWAFRAGRDPFFRFVRLAKGTTEEITLRPVSDGTLRMSIGTLTVKLPEHAPRRQQSLPFPPASHPDSITKVTLDKEYVKEVRMGASFARRRHALPLIHLDGDSIYAGHPVYGSVFVSRCFSASPRRFSLALPRDIASMLDTFSSLQAGDTGAKLDFPHGYLWFHSPHRIFPSGDVKDLWLPSNVRFPIEEVKERVSRTESAPLRIRVHPVEVEEVLNKFSNLRRSPAHTDLVRVIHDGVGTVGTMTFVKNIDPNPQGWLFKEIPHESGGHPRFEYGDTLDVLSTNGRIDEVLHWPTLKKFLGVLPSRLGPQLEIRCADDSPDLCLRLTMWGCERILIMPRIRHSLRVPEEPVKQPVASTGKSRRPGSRLVAAGSRRQR